MSRIFFNTVAGGGVTALATLAAALLAGAAPAEAETSFPYCARFHEAIVYEECSFTTLQQCRETASGRAAECYRDPFYTGPSEPTSKRPRRPHRNRPAHP